MPITERTLKVWRRQALLEESRFDPGLYESTVPGLAGSFIKCQQQIIRMTQELLDQHLLRKK